ncbi:unnamed protein product [Rangifer tarandus platyrhynchus]|uniref:Uncharacterized protein n=1 Tax=Rangifer tarandus platyrhynchus TaxID=3082113 RepID=A0ABN8YSH1_RANTA|nr:unnamed protein product [Rangifer tarandus platyrhynchus]
MTGSTSRERLWEVFRKACALGGASLLGGGGRVLLGEGACGRLGSTWNGMIKLRTRRIDFASPPPPPALLRRDAGGSDFLQK